MLCECGQPLSRCDSTGLMYHTSDLVWAVEPSEDDPGILTPKSNAPVCYPQCCGYLLQTEGGSLHEEL